MRRAIRAARAAVSQNAEDRQACVDAAIRVIYKTASKNVIHRNTADRYVSRLVQLHARKDG